MRATVSILRVLAIAVYGLASAHASGPLELRFDTPATDWQSQALPVGNGSMGAMLFGSPLQERMQFNEITLWTGGANLSGAYDANTFGSYQNLGDLYIDNTAGGPVVTNPSAASHTYFGTTQFVEQSVDGTNAKWCFVHNNANVIWQASYPQPGTVTSYSLKSAEDVPQRDPKSWVLEGSNNGTNWAQLDSRNLSGTTTPVWPFSGRNVSYTFTPTTTGSYRYYRLVFTPNTSVPHFQVAEISLSGTVSTAPTNFSRVLDLKDATHTVRWTQGGVTYTRETIASNPHRLLATRLTASEPGKISVTLRMTGAHGETSASSGDEIGFTGTFANNGLRYASKARVISTGGTLIATNGTLIASNCDSLVIFHAASTDYALDSTTTPAFRNGVDPAVTVAGRLTDALAAGYDAVKAAHLADYQSLFNRATLDLGAPPAQPLTSSRLTAYRAGGADPHLEALLFHYGRYLLISSSRNSLPANLQGLWNNSNSPAWFSDYHVNINLQMNYWAAESTNLAACHKPLFNFLGAIAPLSRAATKASFGADKPGWTMRTTVNPFGGHGWQWDTPSSAWIARHYWDHYLYSSDTQFLQNTAWPVMKEICQFWITQLKDNGAGKLVAPQGWSPEHGPFEDGVSYVQEIVWELFTHTIAAEQVLHNDPVFAAQLVDIRSRLLVPAIGPQGQITEWANPASEASYGYGTGNHRHTSHLYAIYPGHQFNPANTPAYIAAGKLSLADRGTSGDSRQSWTWPWRAALWARMGEGQKAHDMIRGLLTYNAFNNLLVYCQGPIFQIDGSLGTPASMSEMLLQGYDGQVSVLPALPAAWPNGSFTGLRAPGGFEVDAAWQNGAVVSTHIRSTAGQSLTLRTPAVASSPGAFVRGGGIVRAVTRQNSTITFPTVAGGSYAIDTAITGTQDADGDGMTTWQEWLSGTDPDRADSVLKVSLIRNGSLLKATWPEIPGRTYILQSSPDLHTWTPVITHVSIAESSAEYPLPLQPTQNFYRVVVSQTAN